MNAKYEAIADVSGRILLSAIFIFAGVHKVFHWTETANGMANVGMVAVPLFLAATIVVEIAGGLSVATGWRARWGALALAAFLIPATVVFHAFWKDPGQQIMFMKNLAIMGGLLVVVGRGAGPLSLGGRKKG